MTAFWPLWLTLIIVAGYTVKQTLWPAHATRQHDQMRRDWLLAITEQTGTEVLAVQTIRNSLMSCTMTATTATLAFMGCVTWLYSRWPQSLSEAQQATLEIHILAVMILLGLSFITSMLAARQWHHAGFVAGMPTTSHSRQKWLPAGFRAISLAGHYYAVSFRLLIWSAPVVMVGISALIGLAMTLLVLAIFYFGIDR